MSLFEGAWPKNTLSRDAFIERVKMRGGQAYRDLPWRGISDAYGVLVSEVMLQQTQVSRVLGRWEHFLSLFPTVYDLAYASNSDVLTEWQGLGYNRRALALKHACEICANDFKGVLPHTTDELVLLPGIGPATAAGVVAFAYNEPAVYIETNVRTVFLYELFAEEKQVKDKDLAPLVYDTCPQVNPRMWYYALLDYGAEIKKHTENPSRRSAHHTRQSAFEGSHRQKRACVVRIVLAHSGISYEEAKYKLDEFERERGRSEASDEEFKKIVTQLINEGFFTQSNGCFIA